MPWPSYNTCRSTYRSSLPFTRRFTNTTSGERLIQLAVTPGEYSTNVKGNQLILSTVTLNPCGKRHSWTRSLSWFYPACYASSLCRNCMSYSLQEGNGCVHIPPGAHYWERGTDNTILLVRLQSRTRSLSSQQTYASSTMAPYPPTPTSIYSTSSWSN